MDDSQLVFCYSPGAAATPVGASLGTEAGTAGEGSVIAAAALGSVTQEMGATPPPAG